MKTKIFGIIALMLVTVMALSSCSLINNVVDFVNGILNPPVELTDAKLSTEKLIDFADGANPDVLFESDGWSNGSVFNVVWKKDNVKYENGIMKLGITEEKATALLEDVEVEFDYTAGEARTQNYFGYGDFEVSMKPSANPGTASTFFTCTGPYDQKYVLDENGDYALDEDGERTFVENPHDEIDIEFLGNDTTHVQFNFFVDGVGGNEYMHKLGFDASEDFHTYGYRWTPDSITWFVDGVPVYKVTTDTSVKEAGNVRIVEKLPSTPGRILTNYWCGTADAEGWMGKYTGPKNDNGTEYQWIATSAEGAPLNPEEKPDENITGIDWDEIQAINPAFESNDVYTVENDGTTSTITYTAVGGQSYRQVAMDITTLAAGKNYVCLTVTNNADTLANVRVNLNKGNWDAGTFKNLNLSATQDDLAVNTDTINGGSFFAIEGKATAVLVINFTPGAEALELMLDSSTDTTDNHAGNLTFSEIKFATVGEIETPDDDDQNETVPVYADLTGLWKSNDIYVITAVDSKTVTIAYEGLVGSYQCVGAWLQDLAKDNNKAFATITNNGAATVKVLAKMQSANGKDIGKDEVEIKAGETVVVEIDYAGTADDLASQILMHIDSMHGGTDAYSGNVTISKVYFTTAE